MDEWWNSWWLCSGFRKHVKHLLFGRQVCVKCCLVLLYDLWYAVEEYGQFTLMEALWSKLCRFYYEGCTAIHRKLCALGTLSLRHYKH